MGLLDVVDVDIAAQDFIVTLAGGKKEQDRDPLLRRSYRIESSGVLTVFVHRSGFTEVTRYSPHAWESVTETVQDPPLTPIHPVANP